MKPKLEKKKKLKNFKITNLKLKLNILILKNYYIIIYKINILI